jgi:hypothetical protein
MPHFTAGRAAVLALLAAGALAGCRGGTMPREDQQRYSHGTPGERNPMMKPTMSGAPSATAATTTANAAGAVAAKAGGVRASAPAGHGAGGSHG